MMTEFNEYPPEVQTIEQIIAFHQQCFWKYFYMYPQNARHQEYIRAQESRHMYCLELLRDEAQFLSLLNDLNHGATTSIYCG